MLLVKNSKGYLTPSERSILAETRRNWDSTMEAAWPITIDRIPLDAWHGSNRSNHRAPRESRVSTESLETIAWTFVVTKHVKRRISSRIIPEYKMNTLS